MATTHQHSLPEPRVGGRNSAPPGIGPYAATRSAVNMLTLVSRKELAGEGIVVSLVLPSITGTEFGGGRYQVGVAR